MATKTAARELFLQCTVIGNLSAAIKQHSSELIRAHKDSSLSSVAFITRNLLELAIWTEFCIKSPENAKSFCLDSVRDFDDIIKAGAKIGLNTNIEAKPLIKAFKDVRKDIAALLRPGELDKRYKDVRTVAQDIGKLQLFETAVKVLSKMAHPTAFTVMVRPIPSETNSLICTSLTRFGLEMSSEASTSINAFISKVVPPTSAHLIEVK